MTTIGDFEGAANRLQGLKWRPSNEELLDLYGLYKQAKVGDCEAKRPGILDPKGRAKHDAWSACQGIEQDEARRRYVELVEDLLGRDG